MLEKITSRPCEEVLVRFASYQTDDNFLRDQEMSSEQITEMKEFLNSHEMSDSLEELVDAPFEQKRRVSQVTFFGRIFPCWVLLL